MTDVPGELDLSRPDQEPTGELPPTFEGVNPADLDALAKAGWGEGDHEDAGLPDGFWDREPEVGVW